MGQLKNGLTRPAPVGKEGRQPLLGERVFGQIPEHSRWHRRDIGARHGSLRDMPRRAHCGRQNFRIERFVVVVDRPDFPDDFHAIEADIVQPADERRDIGGSGFRREQCLVG